MSEDVISNIQTFGPFFLLLWGITVFFSVVRPQRFLNSFLLMLSLGATVLFVSLFLGDYGGVFLFIMAALVCLALLAVPFFLIINGIRLIRREGLSPAHMLSLCLGIVVGAGELATMIYIFGLTEQFSLENVSHLFLFVAVTVFYFSFLVLCFVLYTIFIQIMPHRMNFNYVIIHGCGLVEGRKLSKLLQNRVDKAIEVYHKCRVKPVLIPSGGKGADEMISEAQAMKEYLLEKGIPEKDIILEDRSETTWENLVYSKKIIDGRPGKKKTALISNNYHIYRCLRLAEKAGLKCTGIGAKVAFYYWPSALIREFIAVFLTKRFLLLALLGYFFIASPFLYAYLFR